MEVSAEIDGARPTDRQREVLDAALSLLVASDETLTMTAVARRASCSKETLYKWFGDRDGLLTATVQWQAAKVRAVPVDAHTLDRDRLVRALEGFAVDWLTVLSGETSVALNRLAVGHAGSEKRDLGAIVLENGPFAMRRRLGSLLEAGRVAGLLRFESAESAFSTFFGLVVRDVQIRLLLGDRAAPTVAEIDRDAGAATRQFFVLFGTSEPAAPIGR
ncbi:TetR/AcrR family transcriptional regulator C-terminal domain-containing protein [Aureimonas pseudogalii]|uniref:TetR/AcrR family transcriptional regulator C-terminal domain-containing protein n=1 Tax=Aureimonas pseudogalii TaxID=1744844 RepID=UPI0016066AAB|nr:TetR/AcrR family transcriptional regulator C-terminal domain-containing protein [Aureimonas pseudogalii]